MSAERPRHVPDAKTMRALAHPVRLALLDAIRNEGEITASRAAELLGDSPGNMSWHLQTLAKYGFVEDTGTGKGRSRPWRLVDRTLSFRSTDTADPETLAAGEALETALINRSYDQLQQWRLRRHIFPEWSEAAFTINDVSYLTPQELDELSADLLRVIQRYDGRREPSERPVGAQPVTLFSFGHPLPAADGLPGAPEADAGVAHQG